MEASFIPQSISRNQVGYALVSLHQGRPVTNSLILAKEFQLHHKNVLRALDTLIVDGTLNRLEFEPVKYQDEKGESRRAIELTERGALIAMPFIGGKKSRIGQVRLVDAFLAMRSELVKQTASWSECRKRVSVAYQLMSDAIYEVRAEDGKTTCSHHYANEAKLVNWVLFGKFERVDREYMAQADLTLLEAVEARNAILIARGRTYEERKAALPDYLRSLRSKPLALNS